MTLKNRVKSIKSIYQSKQLNTMNKLIITSVGETRPEKARIDGKVSRQFMTVQFAEALEDGSPNPFRKTSRNIFQQHSSDGKSAQWRQTPEELRSLMKNKSLIPGEIATEAVESFPVLGANGEPSRDKNGKAVYADRYTAVVLAGESKERIFAAAGHKLISAPASKAAVELQA